MSAFPAIFAIRLERSVLEFRGADVVRFLNGQLSNDVKKLHSGTAIHACVMTAKGRMNAEVWLTKIPDGIRVDGPPHLGDDLLARFERYIISDDVTPSDVTTAHSLCHVVGQTGEFGSHRFGLPGSDFWQGDIPAEIPTLTFDEAESFRIFRGIPAWGAELDENTLPAEAGLERDAIDYHKGCYIGQEVISRIKSVGHVNRHLVRLTSAAPSPLIAGTPLLHDGQPVGHITSVARDLHLENVAALAYVKRAHATPGTVLTADGSAPLTVQSL